MEPFSLVKSSEKEMDRLFSAITAQGMQLNEVAAKQNKLVLMVDGLGVSMNQRFDVFHEELALLRATVTTDLAPRLGEVEKKTGAQKLGAVALVGTKYAGLFTIAGLVLRAVAKQWPEFGGLIEGVLGAAGL